MSEAWLVVGLGNLGTRYARNRHNVGHMVIDVLAGRAGSRLSKHRTRARVAEVRLGMLPGGAPGPRAILAESAGYMNVSGGPVKALVRFYGVDPATRLLVIHDELDLPAHELRLKRGGGEGGHKHRAQLLDRGHAQQAPDVRGRGLHPHPPGDGGGQREQILVVQVIGGQENILRPLGIAPAQPPPQHAHGTAAAHWEDVGPLRLPHETADILHRTPNHSHAAPLFGDLFARRRYPGFSPLSKRLVAHSEYAVRGRFRVAQRLVRRGQPS